MQASQRPAAAKASTNIPALNTVRSVVQEVVGLLPLDEQPLMEAGLDSLGAVELRNSLAARFNLPDLPATLIFDYPSISALAAFISSVLQVAESMPAADSALSESVSEVGPLFRVTVQEVPGV